MTIQLRDNQTMRAGSREQLLSDAVRVLTQAARGTADFAEFVTHALAGAAANLGGIEALLAGRPGSWEAQHVRDLLTATVGHDEQHLLDYRTEPLVVHVHVEDILYDLGLGVLYEQAHEQLAHREDAIAAGQLSGDDEQAALDELDLLHDALEAQYRHDCAAYGAAFTEHVHHAAAQLFPTVPVPVQVIVELDWQNNPGPGREDVDGPAWRLWQTARLTTPLPGSGIPPRDYPDVADIARTERDAGRTPLARLDAETGDPQ